MEMTNSLKDTNYQNSHKEKHNLSRPISISSNLPEIKVPGTDGFMAISTKHLRKKLYQFSTISFRKHKEIWDDNFVDLEHEMNSVAETMH